MAYTALGKWLELLEDGVVALAPGMWTTGGEVIIRVDDDSVTVSAQCAWVGDGVLTLRLPHKQVHPDLEHPATIGCLLDAYGTMSGESTVIHWWPDEGMWFFHDLNSLKHSTFGCRCRPIGSRQGRDGSDGDPARHLKQGAVRLMAIWASIDPSTRKSGVAIWDGDRIIALGEVSRRGPSAVNKNPMSKLWTPYKQPCIIARDEDMARATAAIVGVNSAEFVVYEASIQGSRNPGTLLMLEQLRGDIRSWISYGAEAIGGDDGVDGVRPVGVCPHDIIPMPPSQWRKVTGFNAEKKRLDLDNKQTACSMARDFVVDFCIDIDKHPDVADAVMVGVAWLMETDGK